MSSVAEFDTPKFAMLKHGRGVVLLIRRTPNPEECWYIRTSPSSLNIGSVKSGGQTRSLGPALFKVDVSLRCIEARP